MWGGAVGARGARAAARGGGAKVSPAAHVFDVAERVVHRDNYDIILALRAGGAAHEAADAAEAGDPKLARHDLDDEDEFCARGAGGGRSVQGPWWRERPRVGIPRRANRDAMTTMQEPVASLARVAMTSPSCGEVPEFLSKSTTTPFRFPPPRGTRPAHCHTTYQYSVSLQQLHLCPLAVPASVGAACLPN